MAIASERPVVTVVGFPDEDAPPGVAAIADLAEVRVVAGGSSALERHLVGSEILLVLDFRTEEVRKAWPSARDLRWIHAASAGVDALVFPELRDSEVVLTSARGVFDRPVAEWAIASVLVLAKDLHTTIALQRQGVWKHRETEPVAGRHLLVIGAGGIGRHVARLARALGMDVTLVAREAREDPDAGPVLGVEDLDAALPGAEFVVMAAPLTEQTRGLLDRRRLGLLRTGARVVNVGRGALVDQRALVAALESGQVGGAALDVFIEEPLPAGDPLWAMPNVIVSPHMSGDVVGWRSALTDQFVANLRRWIAGEPLDGVVDKQAGYARNGGADG